MNYSQNVYRGIGDSKNHSVFANDQMAITGSEDFVFRNKGTATGRLRKFLHSGFQLENKSVRILDTVGGYVIPDLLKIDRRIE
jgi:hypothetical protein